MFTFTSSLCWLSADECDECAHAEGGQVVSVCAFRRQADRPSRDRRAPCSGDGTAGATARAPPAPKAHMEIIIKYIPVLALQPPDQISSGSFTLDCKTVLAPVFGSITVAIEKLGLESGILTSFTNGIIIMKDQYKNCLKECVKNSGNFIGR